jgi:RNA polymerase sigma factor (sigma-70 family)
MSPLSLRRHRAERLLREEFEGLRGRVLSTVAGRLRASGVSIDQGDLEACYATAWQGLYAAVLDGQEIANPTGWLVLVTFRRAIEEHRARKHAHFAGELRLDENSAPRSLRVSETETAGAAERDFAAELDDRMRLRQLFEALRGRLNGREREAATLCYLQGLSRTEAAARMGVSEARMRKLMEGHGPSRPGVAGKVGALVQSIRDGDWCDEQGSLMRAFAYGILDPAGERYQLALAHQSQCSACRAYVVSLRGLAAALPPVLLPWGIGAAALARAAEGVHASGAAAAGSGAGGMAGGGIAGGGSGAACGTAGGGVATGGTAGGGGVATGGTAGGGSLAASGAAGAAGASGAAGGGWLIGAGPLSAKLAVGCLLALGVGAGCAALEAGHPAHASHHGSSHSARFPAHATVRSAVVDQLGDLAGSVGSSLPSSTPRGDSSSSLTPSAKASREFGPQALSSGGSASKAAGRDASIARSASSGAESLPTSGSSKGEGADGEGADGEASDTGVPATAVRSTPDDSTAAEREFSPG